MILADEPTAHLDYIQVEGVLKLVRELADDGRLVVVATHDERLIPLADGVVNLTPRADTSPREPEVVRLAAGQELFAQGERGELVYTVDEGEIEIVRTPRRRHRGAGRGRSRPATTSASWRRCSGSGGRPPPGRSAPAVVTGYGLRDFRERFDLTAPKVLAQAGD